MQHSNNTQHNATQSYTKIARLTLPKETLRAYLKGGMERADPYALLVWGMERGLMTIIKKAARPGWSSPIEELKRKNLNGIKLYLKRIIEDGRNDEVLSWFLKESGVDFTDKTNRIPDLSALGDLGTPYAVGHRALKSACMQQFGAYGLAQVLIVQGGVIPDEAENGVYGESFGGGNL